jgi:hypothetical protein
MTSPIMSRNGSNPRSVVHANITTARTKRCSGHTGHPVNSRARASRINVRAAQSGGTIYNCFRGERTSERARCKKRYRESPHYYRRTKRALLRLPQKGIHFSVSALHRDSSIAKQRTYDAITRVRARSCRLGSHRGSSDTHLPPALTDLPLVSRYAST